MKSRNNHSN